MRDGSAKGAGKPDNYAPWPTYADDEIRAVESVLRSGRVNYWTGAEGRAFEHEFARFTGVNHALFVANGTVALEIALRALDLPPGSEVVTTPRTFIATAAAIVSANLKPVFADVDPESGNITVDAVRAVLSTETVAVLVVHLGGWPAELVGLRAFCDAAGLALIEDCSQAHGARIGGRHVGTFGDLATWSFCQDKIITTGGEGGMIATNDEYLWRRMWALKDHGKSWEAVFEREHPPGFRWLHESFGTNGRGTEMQAAIGRVQYRKLEGWHEERRNNAEVLAAHLSKIEGVSVPMPTNMYEHAFYRLYAYLDESIAPDGQARDRIVHEVTSAGGVPIFSGACSEVYLELAFAALGDFHEGYLPVAHRLGEQSIAFLVHPGLSQEDLATVAEKVSKALDSKAAVSAP